jgi:hypothetical protein
MDDLLAVLGRERHALGNLLFRLLEARNLLATGEARFLHLIASDIDAAAEAVREVELARVLLTPVASGLTLRELAIAARPPIDGILDDHRLAISRLAGEVGAATETVSDMAQRLRARVRDNRLVSAGRVGAVDDLDREIIVAGYGAVLNASARLTLPSLVRFLG